MDYTYNPDDLFKFTSGQLTPRTEIILYDLQVAVYMLQQAGLKVGIFQYNYIGSQPTGVTIYFDEFKGKEYALREMKSHSGPIVPRLMVTIDDTLTSYNGFNKIIKYIEEKL